MSNQQIRPLSGMVVSGVAAPRVLTGADSLIHQLDTLATQQGGPYVDLVSLYVQNPTGAGVDLLLTVAGGSVITQTITSKAAAVLVLDNVPFQTAANATAANTQIVGHGTGLVFWGTFSRPV